MRPSRIYFFNDGMIFYSETARFYEEAGATFVEIDTHEALLLKVVANGNANRVDVLKASNILFGPKYLRYPVYALMKAEDAGDEDSRQIKAAVEGLNLPTDKNGGDEASRFKRGEKS